MLKKIKLQNFKSFKNFEVEFKRPKESPNIYFIYGENGSGKSNLVSSIEFFKDLSNSFNLQDRFSGLFDATDLEKQYIKQLIKDFRRQQDIETLIKNIRRIGSRDDILLEYVFELYEKEFTYQVILNNTKIIKESLKGPLNVDRVNIFKISYENELLVHFNNALFSRSYSNEIKELISQYFGKHTLLSILNNELRKKNIEYLENNINETVLVFLHYINLISTSSPDEVGFFSTDNKHINELPIDLESGELNKVDKLKLERAEELLNMYFTGLYSDVKSVYYKIDEMGQTLRYKLYFKKMIGGNVIDVPFSIESSGTKKLLELFPYFVNLLNGDIVVIDEFESSIHDMLIIEIIKRLGDADLKGQLIATTHNTSLLEELNRDNVYILNVDDLGNKKIYNVKDSGFRIQQNHSLYQNYKKGVFGGVPSPGYFDFNDICDCLKDNDNDE